MRASITLLSYIDRFLGLCHIVRHEMEFRTLAAKNCRTAKIHRPACGRPRPERAAGERRALRAGPFDARPTQIHRTHGGGLRVDGQKLQQFISDSPWLERRVWQAIRREVIPVMEPLQAWVVDETGWLKQGQDSVGVSQQYCGAVGKQAQCQVAVELTVTDGEVAAPVGGRLYLPEAWTKDRSRREKAGVPTALPFQTKPEMAGDLITEALADGLTAAPILGDSV